MQSMLRAAGAYGVPSASNKNVVDGVWGPGTTSAVQTYQTAKGLSVDGCIGWNTSTALRDSWVRQMPDLDAGGTLLAQKYVYDNGSTGVQIRQVRDMYSNGCYWFNWNGWRSYYPGFPTGGLPPVRVHDEDKCSVGSLSFPPKWQW